MIRYITDEGEILESDAYVLREIHVGPFYEVVNLETSKPLKCFVNSKGYVSIGPSFNGKQKACRLHRLVLSTFNPEGYFPGAEANHIDENKLNCKFSNLNWLSCKDNINHGTHNQRIGETLTNRKDLSKPVIQYTKDGTFVAEYPSIAEASRQTGITHIGHCCNGYPKYSHAGGFVWRYK